MTNLTLKVKVKVTSFKLNQNLCMINKPLMCKAKYQIGKFKTNILKSLKATLELKVKVKVTRFCTNPRPFDQ